MAHAIVHLLCCYDGNFLSDTSQCPIAYKVPSLDFSQPLQNFTHSNPILAFPREIPEPSTNFPNMAASVDKRYPYRIGYPRLPTIPVTSTPLEASESWLSEWGTIWTNIIGPVLGSNNITVYYSAIEHRHHHDETVSDETTTCLIVTDMSNDQERANCIEAIIAMVSSLEECGLSPCPKLELIDRQAYDGHLQAPISPKEREVIDT
jgi:hypothetical protein